jgi:hypothetical protein
VPEKSDYRNVWSAAELQAKNERSPELPKLTLLLQIHLLAASSIK